MELAKHCKVFAHEGASVVLLSRDPVGEAAAPRWHTEPTLAMLRCSQSRRYRSRAGTDAHHFDRVDVWVITGRGHPRLSCRHGMSDARNCSKPIFRTSPAPKRWYCDGEAGAGILSTFLALPDIPVPFMAIYPQQVCRERYRKARGLS